MSLLHLQLKLHTGFSPQQLPLRSALPSRAVCRYVRRPFQPFTTRKSSHPVCASNQQQQPSDKPAFGYTRKDVILIGVGLVAFGYALKYGLQAFGMEEGMAGNWVQLIVFVGLCVGWISTYIFRVATKQMTYVQQLEQYEAAVMKKRMDEMTEAEMQEVLKEVEEEKEKRGR